MKQLESIKPRRNNVLVRAVYEVPAFAIGTKDISISNIKTRQLHVITTGPDCDKTMDFYKDVCIETVEAPFNMLRISGINETNEFSVENVIKRHAEATKLDAKTAVARIYKWVDYFQIPEDQIAYDYTDDQPEMEGAFYIPKGKGIILSV